MDWQGCICMCIFQVYFSFLYSVSYAVQDLHSLLSATESSESRYCWLQKQTTSILEEHPTFDSQKCIFSEEGTKLYDKIIYMYLCVYYISEYNLKCTHTCTCRWPIILIRHVKRSVVHWNMVLNFNRVPQKFHVSSSPNYACTSTCMCTCMCVWAMLHVYI